MTYPHPPSSAPTTRSTLSDPSPAVVNVRRPHPTHAEPGAARPLSDRGGLDDAPLPPTAMRLPDLAKLPHSFGGLRLSWATAGEAAQWFALGLGALIALWLIFGGRRGEVPKEGDTPAWTAPSRAAAPAEPPTWTPPAPDAPEAPAWQPSAPAPAADSPATSGPYESSAPELPQPDMSRSTAGGPAVRTAQRPDYAPHVSGDSPPAEAQSLGITVSVPQ